MFPNPCHWNLFSVNILIYNSTPVAGSATLNSVIYIYFLLLVINKIKPASNIKIAEMKKMKNSKTKRKKIEEKQDFLLSEFFKSNSLASLI